MQYTLKLRIGKLIENRLLLGDIMEFLRQCEVIQWNEGISKNIVENTVKDEYTYNGRCYNWFDVDWHQQTENRLIFKNSETGETVYLDNNISSYSVSFAPALPEWIEESSRHIVINNDDIINRD